MNAKQILARWKANRASLAETVRAIVAIGYSVDQDVTLAEGT